MPVCFQLYSKTSGKIVPLATIDKELCAMLDVTVHPERYVCNWVDTIGLNIALGRALGSQELRDNLHKFFGGPEADEYNAMRWRCLEYLEANYMSDSWLER